MEASEDGLAARGEIPVGRDGLRARSALCPWNGSRCWDEGFDRSLLLCQLRRGTKSLTAATARSETDRWRSSSTTCARLGTTSASARGARDSRRRRRRFSEPPGRVYGARLLLRAKSKSLPGILEVSDAAASAELKPEDATHAAQVQPVPAKPEPERIDVPGDVGKRTGTVQYRCPAVVALCAAAVLLSASTFVKSWTARRRATRYVPTCHADGCALIDSEMRDLVSAQFDPCVDFYDYVCGSWTGAPERFSSFVDDQRVYAKAATVAYLLELLSKEKVRQDTVVASMASVYNGCVEHFATRKSLDSVADEVLHALNVRLETWRNSTLAGMLPRLVEFSLLYRLHSFFALTFESRSTPLRMTVGKVVRNISAAAYSLDKLYSYFETMVVAFDKAAAARYELLRALVKLDGTVHKVTKMASKVETTLPLEQLDMEGVPHEMWPSSINRAFSLNSEVSLATKIVVRSIGGIRDAFSAMVRTDSAVSSMYLLVLVTSQAIRYEFYERYAEVEQRVGWMHVSCTEVLSRLFPTHYTNLEATALRGHVHNTSASELLEESREYLMDSLNDSATIDAAAKDRIREQLRNVDVVFVEPVNVGDLLAESDAEHTQSYIENMFSATRQEAVERALNKSRWPANSRMLARMQWLGSFSYVEKLRAIVIASQNFLSVPQFSSDISRKVSNYAILLARFVRELLVALPHELADTDICSPLIQDRVSFVSESQAVELFRQAKSLRLAYQAYKQRKRICYGIEESGLVSFDRNFFQVFCVQFCSHPLLEPTPSLLRMRDRCEISVRSLPEFREAYKCPDELGKRDCLVPRQPY